MPISACNVDHLVNPFLRQRTSVVVVECTPVVYRSNVAITNGQITLENISEQIDSFCLPYSESIVSLLSVIDNQL